MCAWRAVCIPLVAALGCAPGCQQLDEPDGGGIPMPVDTDAFDDDSTGVGILEGGGNLDDEGSGGGGRSDACDPVSGTPCPASQKCTAVLIGGTPSYRCVGETGSRAIGEDCSVSLSDGLDDCAAGSVCLGDEAGTCRPLCESESDCTGALCIEDPFAGVPHCANDCSPFEPSCASGLQCRRQSDRFSCIDPVPGDDGGPGEPCSIIDDAGCAGGLVCISGALVPGCGTQGCCVTLCDLDAQSTCSAPTTCTPALESPAPGFEAIGACFVPA